MSDRAAFVAAVSAAPDDDLPKLVFADWLDENGDPDRAEFVRLQVATAREATAFPPASDPAKLARIRELFQAHHLAWLRPVYEPLGQPLPTFGSRPPRPPDDRWAVQPTGGVAVSHPIDRAVPSVVFNGGLMDTLLLQPSRLPESASLAAAVPHEPLDRVHLTLPGLPPDGWRRFDGPHLSRVRELSVQFGGTRNEGVGELAERVCDAARFPGVREFTVTPEVWGRGDPPTAVLFDTLCGSSLRHQLTTLTLYDLPHLTRLLSRADHGFDALRVLAVSSRGQPEAAGVLHSAGISNWFRARLTRLALDTTRTHGLLWLTNGQAWEHLEVLSLSGHGVGDTGAAAVARADTLPELRELRLSRVHIGDTGATALAASPLVGRLRALILDGNPITDTGAVRLAEALDRGLGYLSLRDIQPALSSVVVRQLSARYGSWVAFGR